MAAMYGQPQQGFGPEQQQQVEEILSQKNARAIFLAISDAMPRPVSLTARRM